MSSFLTSNSLLWITGNYSRSFDTFSQDGARTVTVFKEPKKTFINIDVNNYAGYGNESNENNIEYTIISGVYPAEIKPNKKQTTQQLEDLNIRVMKGEILIKVKEDARNFISEGKNEKFLVDGLYYNKIADEAVENFFGLKFYIYGLERTN